MTQKRAANLLVECLINQGVDKIYGVPGESYLSVLDALYDFNDKINFISTRHESAASFMAEAYGKLTGEVGICFVTRGPGATNASIGVHTAMQNSSPMILFIGQIGRDMTEREAFQEIDYKAYFGSISKWVVQVNNADRLPEIIGRAFSMALSGRPGPVVVSLPEDMLRDLTSAVAINKIQKTCAEISVTQVNLIKDELEKSKKPLIICGGGGWSDIGRDYLKRFAESVNIPVICGFRNQDLMDTNSFAYVGDASFGKPQYIKDLIKNSDLILAINIRFGEVITDAWSLFDFPHPKQKIIHTHVSEAEINKVYHCELGVVASPDSVVQGLYEARVSRNPSSSLRRNREDFVESRKIVDTQGTLNVAKICNYLNIHSDKDAIFTNGAGNFAVWSGKYLNYSKEHRLLAPQAGAMGAGVPAALAAKSIYPNRQVICFAGDGDFQMSASELGTAMQEGLNPIILIHNNGSYGTIRMHQEMRYPKRVSGTNLKNPNFKCIAEAYNFGYSKITNLSEFKVAFEKAKTIDVGFIIEMLADIKDISPGKIIDL
ncbi:MAG: acetolactate synthase II large subunit [Rhodobacterales bacterium]|jgi:acetolactate synthase-1/2/3 large subunit|nr:acetolactate synthase II large subunit [Rhodobacterales bacterium]